MFPTPRWLRIAALLTVSSLALGACGQGEDPDPTEPDVTAPTAQDEETIEQGDDADEAEQATIRFLGGAPTPATR